MVESITFRILVIMKLTVIKFFIVIIDYNILLLFSKNVFISVFLYCKT